MYYSTIASQLTMTFGGSRFSGALGSMLIEVECFPMVDNCTKTFLFENVARFCLFSAPLPLPFASTLATTTQDFFRL
jgi:hypothetical protein